MNGHKNIKLAITATIAVLVGAILLVWTLRTKQQPPDNTSQPKHILELRLAAFQLYASALVVAADQSGKIVPATNCFGDAGLKTTIIKRSKGPEIVDALVGGSADFGTLAITPQVLQALQGSDL